MEDNVKDVDVNPSTPSHCTIRVRYAETDAMGVAHHSSYVVWLELARVAWLAERGASYREMTAAGVNLAVSALHVSYKKSAFFDDVIHIATTLQTVHSRKLTFTYTLTRRAEKGEKDGKVHTIATATTSHICLNAQGRPIRLPARWQQFLVPPQ